MVISYILMMESEITPEYGLVEIDFSTQFGSKILNNLNSDEWVDITNDEEDELRKLKRVSVPVYVEGFLVFYSNR